MDQTDNATRDAWFCDHCRLLVYNTDETGRPIAGASAPLWGNEEYKSLCTLCFQMLEALKGPYWDKLHIAWAVKNAGYKKLKPGEDYFQS